jgi:hypothetical protein
MEGSMRKTLAALSVGAALGLVYFGGAAAMPAALLQQVATQTSPVQPAQCNCYTNFCCADCYAERRTKNYVVKCYRKLGIGKYGCHRYPYR